jgi:hypothetical protein
MGRGVCSPGAPGSKWKIRRGKYIARKKSLAVWSRRRKGMRGKIRHGSGLRNGHPRPEPAFGKPVIMGLGNSSLLRKTVYAAEGAVEEPAGNKEKKSRGRKKNNLDEAAASLDTLGNSELSAS